MVIVTKISSFSIIISVLLLKVPASPMVKLVPCSDHHQVVQEARAHFLFLHLGLTTSCTSAHLGCVLAVESVVPSHRSRRASGGKSSLLAAHRSGWKINKTCKDIRERCIQLELEQVASFPPPKIKRKNKMNAAKPGSWTWR